MTTSTPTQERNEILSTLEPLFKEAKQRDLWFFSPYQELWFSPRQLRQFHAAGRFVWGPVNWELRDPREMIHAARRNVETAQKRLRELEQMVELEGRSANEE